MLVHGSILRREHSEISDDLVEDSVRESSAKHFKGFYIVSFYNWFQANLRSDIHVLDFRKAYVEIVFCSDN
jgi:hypothetical protein